MERQFQCDICELKFPFMSKLERHMNLHTGEKQYHCDVCDFKTAHKYNLTAHHKSVHMGQKPYQCTICGLSYNRRNELVKHQQLKHLLMIPYQQQIEAQGATIGATLDEVTGGTLNTQVNETMNKMQELINGKSIGDVPISKS